jgi:hypothetical protein
MRGGTQSASRPDSASRLDVAIDALLAGRAALLSAEEPEDLELLTTAKLLHDGLPRFHPRFGFEELLARRLAVERVGHGPGAHADDVRSAPTASSETLHHRALEADATVTRGSLRRRILVAGGAVASGLSLAVPLAGAALAAWRRSRPSGGVG